MPDAPGVTDRLGVRPVPLYVVQPELAARVAAPPYDTLTPAAAAAAAADPLNFLNVLRAPPDNDGAASVPVGGDSDALRRLLRDGVFVAAMSPRFAWYRLATDGHSQTGLIAEVAVADYDAGRIVRHEHTRADREEQLAAYQQTVAADASPVALAYRPDERMDELMRRATAGPPHLRFTSDDGVEHSLWTTQDDDLIADACRAAGALRRLYITDGHHRFAAASRVAAARRAAGSGPDAPDQWLLAALFDGDQLRILPFHRSVTRPRELTTAQLLARLATRVDVEPLDPPQPPARPHTFSAWVDGDWYRLTVPADAVGTGPLAGLDVAVLHEQLLIPILGVTEPRFDPRLHYPAGGPQDVAAHCERERAIGFMVRAPSMAQLMAAADAELVMPPKSTLFSPKIRSGIILRLTA